MLYRISPENSSISKKLELSISSPQTNNYIQTNPSNHCFTKTISMQNFQSNKYPQNNINNIPINKTLINVFDKKINFNQNSPNTKQNNINPNKKSFVNINNFLGEKCPITLEILNKEFKKLSLCKTSTKSMGLIKAYGVNTNQGIVRNYNEDRVTIIINMIKPINYIKPYWPKISFFGIYDGHGGNGCAEFLKDNLHKFIANDKNFPENISESIYSGFYKAEKEFLNNFAINKNTNIIKDKSGSCALIMLLIDTKIYIANVGDSRCILSLNNGTKYKVVTEDHKPNSEKEKKRILENGGKIYQSQTPISNLINKNSNQILLGPYRVFPGRLSCSRTIGDIEAKKIEFGGNPNVIIPKPNIYMYDLLKEDIDFFIMGCDGIYDQLTNNEILDAAWQVFKNKNNNNLHNQCGKITDFILKCAMARKSFDNITCLLICFKEIGVNNNITKLNSHTNLSKKLTKLNYNLDNINLPFNKILNDNNKPKNDFPTYDIELPKIKKIDSFSKGENAIFNKIKRYRSKNRTLNNGRQNMTEATLNFKKLYNSRYEEMVKNNMNLSSITNNINNMSNRNSINYKNSTYNTNNINNITSVEDKNKYKSIIFNNNVLNLIVKQQNENNNLADLKKRIPKCLNYNNRNISHTNNEKLSRISHYKTNIVHNIKFDGQSKEHERFSHPDASYPINKNQNNYWDKNYENIDKSPFNTNNKLVKTRHNNNLYEVKKITRTKSLHRNGNNLSINRNENNKYHTKTQVNILVKNYTRINNNVNNMIINNINTPKKMIDTTFIENNSKRLERKKSKKKEININNHYSMNRNDNNRVKNNMSFNYSEKKFKFKPNQKI